MRYAAIDPDVLGCIVTGYGKGGTTLIKDLLVQTTDMVSRFEGGLLLSRSPADGIPQPHARNLLDSWQLGPDFLDRYSRCGTFEEGYRLLRESSAALPSREAPLLDKMPEYMVQLDDVMRRAPHTPVVCVVRDPLHVVVSWLQLGNSLFESIAWVRASSESLLATLGRRDRRLPLYIVNLTDMVRQPEPTLRNLQVWLGRWPRPIVAGARCGMPYAAGGRNDRPRGIETDRHDVSKRRTPEELAVIRREVLEAMPYAESLAAIPSGPATSLESGAVAAAA
jgi:hypothetical protein